MGTLLDLGTQPLVNNLSASPRDALNAEQFSLKALYEEDLTIHLDTEIAPSKLYQSYLYRSGVSEPYAKHCRAMYDTLKHLDLSTVIDVGGNDGTLLNTFKQAAKETSFWSGKPPQRLINVDMSASLQEINEKNGIEFICGQFNDAMDLPQANLIVSTNVFQHTKDIHSFLRGIVKFLDGVWVLEFPYTLNTLATLQFDQFYHEHYYYWLVTPLQALFKQYGLRIIHLEEQSIHGGSMRLWMTNKQTGAGECSDALSQWKQREALINFQDFNAACKKHIEKSQQFIGDLKGRTVFFGAAAKGCVFLNAIGLSIDNMPDAFVIDDTPSKQGLFIPGAGFQVCNRRDVEFDKIDNIIVLAHNFSDYIACSLRQHYGGKIYTCLPAISEVS